MKKSKVYSVIARVFGWLVYFVCSLILGGAADVVLEKQMEPEMKSEDEEVRKKAEKKKFLLTVAYGTSISIALRWLWLKADKEIQDFFS